MKVFTEIAEVRAFSRECRRQGKRIGFVPTMGFLHEGHLSLVKIARRHSDVVIASNYVNPTQFAAHEDFDVYPIERSEDREKLKAIGCDVVYEPASLYSVENGRDTAFVVGQKERASYQTFVNVECLEKPLCGITRPHFFRGVATIVAKLFNIVEPHVAVFGLKDYQQFQIIKTMTRELNFDIEIIGGPIQRESDGLAMSSRNALLHADARHKCSVLYQSLKWAEEMLRSNGTEQTSPDSIIREIERQISEEGGKVDYVRVVDVDTLQDVRQFASHEAVVIAVAAFFANKEQLPLVRLIDNIKVSL